MGSEIPNNRRLDVKNPVYNGIDCQPQLVWNFFLQQQLPNFTLGPLLANLCCLKNPWESIRIHWGLARPKSPNFQADHFFFNNAPILQILHLICSVVSSHTARIPLKRFFICAWHGGHGKTPTKPLKFSLPSCHLSIVAPTRYAVARVSSALLVPMGKRPNAQSEHLKSSHPPCPETQGVGEFQILICWLWRVPKKRFKIVLVS